MRRARRGQVRIDYAYGLEFTETPERAADISWRLRIGGEFVFTDPLGHSQRIDPEGEAASLGPALIAATATDRWRYLGKRTHPAGVCEWEHRDVEPHDRYEAWTLASDGRPPQLFVCSPGGGHVDWGT